jgi:hypothetical protein
MDWSGSDEWKAANRGLWIVNDQPAGYAKAFKNLNFVVVYNSGHLVPYNVPENALDLITRFLNNATFYDKDLPSFSSGTTTSSSSATTPQTTDTSSNDNNRDDDDAFSIPLVPLRLKKQLHQVGLWVVLFTALLSFGAGIWVAGHDVNSREGYLQVPDANGILHGEATPLRFK